MKKTVSEEVAENEEACPHCHGNGYGKSYNLFDVGIVSGSVKLSYKGGCSACKSEHQQVVNEEYLSGNSYSRQLAFSQKSYHQVVN